MRNAYLEVFPSRERFHKTLQLLRVCDCLLQQPVVQELPIRTRFTTLQAVQIFGEFLYEIHLGLHVIHSDT